METLRRRIRDGRLQASRGPHGRYYIVESDLGRLLPPRRMKSRQLGPQVFDAVALDIDEQLELKGWLRWQRKLVETVRADPGADRHLYRVLATHAFVFVGLNTVETAGLLGISTRQVRRLRKRTLDGALTSAYQRGSRAERGRLRKQAIPIVDDIRARLRATGFQPATRWLRPVTAAALTGRKPRLVVVRNLNLDQVRDLFIAGLSKQQVAAIQLVGIGVDELNELILYGLPPPVSSPSGSSKETTHSMPSA